MSRFPEDKIIQIDNEKSIIKFKQAPYKREKQCEHASIQISVSENELLCTDCNIRLNPVWWIQKYMKQINAVSERNTRLVSEYREIWKKLDKKRSFMCKECHEVNLIDFRKLPSSAAVIRGISLIESEDLGMKIVIE